MFDIDKQISFIYLGNQSPPSYPLQKHFLVLYELSNHMSYSSMITVLCPASHSNSSLSISAYYNNRLNQFLLFLSLFHNIKLHRNVFKEFIIKHIKTTFSFESILAIELVH